MPANEAACEMSRRAGSVAGGLALTGCGACALSLGLLRSPFLPTSVFGAPGAGLVSAAGFLLLVAGLVVSLFSFRSAPEQLSIVPAHVAFRTRAPRAISSPEKVALPAARPRVRSREPGAEAVVNRLDDEIRELTRRINKAGVMLATGQISHQGYASYVEELKKQRGELEAKRVRIELHRQ